MASYVLETVSRPTNDHSCRETSCKNTKLTGFKMRLCTQCRTIYYCSPECQRKDWARHKAWCKEQAAEVERERSQGGNRVSKHFDAWIAAIGPALITRICVQALAVYRHPDNVQTKFLLVALHEATATGPLKALEYQKTYAFDRSEFPSILGFRPDNIMEQICDDDAKTRSQGGIGTVLVIVAVKPLDPTQTAFLRVVPVKLGEEELQCEEEVQWEDMVKETIKNGKAKDEGVTRTFVPLTQRPSRTRKFA
ncbi:hypothetical protein FB451DRAFT_1257331 [Mycena latifolia]|nr:hypothetical protein FB451DRAFT_1257331 [Mycena latifolia]